MVKIARRNIPSALNNPATLAFLRMIVDDHTIAELADRILAAMFKKNFPNKKWKRADRHASIAHWLKMDADKLSNWLNRSKRPR
jgi:hypothetical protein